MFPSLLTVLSVQLVPDGVLLVEWGLLPGLPVFPAIGEVSSRAWFHWFELLQCRCIRHPTTISHEYSLYCCYSMEGFWPSNLWESPVWVYLTRSFYVKTHVFLVKTSSNLNGFFLKPYNALEYKGVSCKWDQKFTIFCILHSTSFAYP